MLKMEVIKPHHSPYKNSWYLVKKIICKKYYFVNLAGKFNRVTVRDTNLSLSADECSKKFASCAISSLIKFFLSYN